MNEYAKSMEEVINIRKGGRTEKFNCVEMKEYRRFTGKLSWLAQGTHPDINYIMLVMQNKNNSATLADFQKVNKVLKKVKLREC